MRRSDLILAIIVSIINLLAFPQTWAGLDSKDMMQLFVSHIIYKSITPVVHEAWEIIKTANKTGELRSQDFEENVLWGEIILKKLKALDNDLKTVDRVVEANRPAKYLNQIIRLLDMKSVNEMTKKLATSKQATLIEFWKEGWVKLSSMLIQLHHKYDWIFSHAFSEGYPGNVNHDLMDDIITLMDLKDVPYLPYKNRYHYVWMKLSGADRGVKYEQFSQTLDEVAGYTKIVTSGSTNGKDLTNNMFVGLRVLLKMHPEIVGPYKDLDQDTDPCAEGKEYGGISGVNYHIPVYILMYILNAEMKYYLLRNFAEMQKCVKLGDCNYEMVNKIEKHLKVYYKFYYDEMINAFKANDDPLKDAPPNAWRWRCDPHEHKEDDSYSRFYDFDTHFMAEERQISLTQTCRDSCDMFDGAFSTIPCEDTSWDCLEADDDFDCWERNNKEIRCPAKARTICPNEGLVCMTTKIQHAKVCPGEDRDRRFISWIDSDGKLKIMGKRSDENCNISTEIYTTAQGVERSGITKFEPQQCEVCLCRCYEPMGSRTHRYISIVPQMSDISNGRVLSGVRFVKTGDVIHIAVADAKITDNGLTLGETLEWHDPKPVDITNEQQVFRLARDARTILLDDLVAPLGYVVTGIRFKPTFIPMDRMHVKELMFQLHITRMNETGGLDIEDSGWIYNHNDSRRRQEIFLENSDVPIRVAGFSKPISKSNDFLRIQASALKADAGQTPIPFVDTQQVVIESLTTATTLRGVGLYFKRSQNSGGFLAFRLITDVVHHLPPNDTRYDLWHQLILEDMRSEHPRTEPPHRSQPTIPPIAGGHGRGAKKAGASAPLRLQSRPVADALEEAAEENDDVVPLMGINVTDLLTSTTSEAPEVERVEN